MGKQQPPTTAGGERELSHVLRAPPTRREERWRAKRPPHLSNRDGKVSKPPAAQTGQRPCETASCDQPRSSDCKSAPVESPIDLDISP